MEPVTPMVCPKPGLFVCTLLLCPLCCIMGQQTLVEYTQCRTNEICTMYIEEFILVDIWIHCCTVHETGLNEHWKNAGLYTLATKE